MADAASSDVKPGFRSSEFWLQLLAHFAPMLAGYLMTQFAPEAPYGAAAVAVVTAVAGHYSAGQYAQQRTDLKTVASAAIEKAAAAVAAAPAAK